MSAIEVDEHLRAAVLHFGADGQRWLDGLPELVAGLAADWGITVGRALAGGNFAYVAEAVTAEGRLAVLKVALPPAARGPQQELRGLQAAHGDPYAELIRYDEARRSMLLERLGRPLGELGWSTERQIAVTTSTVARGWRPVDGDGQGLESGAKKAAWLAEFIALTWRKLDQPCSEQTIERAIDYAGQRARSLVGQQPVLVHGDAHPWNVLEARPEGVATGTDDFRLIDPEGLASEPAHDLGVVLRGWNEELLQTDTSAVAVERCEAVGRSTGVDRESIWQWSYVERVSSGLFLLELGHRADAEAYLGVADRLAGVTPTWA